MTIFLKGNDLNAELESIFEQAEKHLLLISPYIKLHDRYSSALKAKKENYDLQIVVVFGKNEDDYSKSMKQEDFNFFKEFPNIQIRYEKRLHAKYYANENSAILTSMNLYTFSQDNNIEAGVLMDKKGLIGSFTSQDNLDSEAFNYFDLVIKQSDLLFSKVPQFEKTNFGLSKRYSGSVIETDKLSDFFENKLKNVSSYKSERAAFKQPIKQMGYCIRTKAQIPFNQKVPMCDSAFQSWKKFSNKEYPEKYCHFSGELANGETTFSRPILRKNWAKAKELFGL